RRQGPILLLRYRRLQRGALLLRIRIELLISGALALTLLELLLQLVQLIATGQLRQRGRAEQGHAQGKGHATRDNCPDTPGNRVAASGMVFQHSPSTAGLDLRPSSST